jgi:16S rRNA (cytosine967-C5)-methyltransferase
MLDRAAGWLEPGGTLVYATCSLEPHEGEAQIGPFLDRHPEFEVRAIAQDELPEGVTPDAFGCLRTKPGMLAEQGGLDGFFAARFVRK